MNWEQYHQNMGRIIKTDTMSADDGYFMATHMPFSKLEVIRGGLETGQKAIETEDQIFGSIIANPDNRHRLVIVRGSNGTGKSHLIRYFHAKFQSSPGNVYNPDKEEVVFLRRLNNSVRGVFSQLLQQNVIRNPDIIAKLEKFIASSEAKDEDEFKTDILLAFIGAVVSDKSESVYKTVICRNIAQFLSDNRVQNHLLRDDGAINRCYRMITTPSDQVLKDTTIFSEDDFNNRKIIRAVLSHGHPEAEDFANTLKTDDSEYQKLADYLNRFVPQVIQKCADISSESTKTVFEDLRRDLKMQGKNLTLFIEDFTGFTGIASELITVLSTEHGGQYEHLCRVTAIIGITDGYYDQFKDNFKERVTHQINVTEESFESDDFLVQMSALYLNAIYCEASAIENWDHSVRDALPISGFTPPCEWEFVELEGKKFTLYPFNRKALTLLYHRLPTPSPRRFLSDILAAQLKEYLDGKEYESDYQFPLKDTLSHAIEMDNAPHSSFIDSIENISHDEKQRIKRVLAIWGDGSAYSEQGADGVTRIGGLSTAFFADISLPIFEGIDSSPRAVKTTKVQAPLLNIPHREPDQEEPSNAVPSVTKPEPSPAPVVDRQALAKEKAYQKKKADIAGWFSNKDELQYHADYRGWIKSFLCGSGSSTGAINWQDVGIPAYIAAERLSNYSVIQIEGQSDGEINDKTLVYLSRSAETRDALMALCEYDYAGDWGFQGGLFYQQKLITWLERNRCEIQDKVAGMTASTESTQVAEWCLAVLYLKSLIFGHKIDMTSSFTIAKSLTQPMVLDSKIKRVTTQWNDLITFATGKEAEFKSAYDLLRKSTNTTLGAVSGAKSNVNYIYRTSELLVAVERLMAANWDIEDTLTAVTNDNLLTKSAILLKALYKRMRSVVDAEKTKIEELKTAISSQTGELNQENLIDVFSGIHNFLRTVNQNGSIIRQELLLRYDEAPLEMAKKILIPVMRTEEASHKPIVEAMASYSENYSQQLATFNNQLLELERLALKEKSTAETNLVSVRGIIETDSVSQAALESLGALYDRLEAMEVQDVTRYDE